MDASLSYPKSPSAGLGPAVHVLILLGTALDVDGRDKPGQGVSRE
jgi:hypothetical protein